MRPTGALLLSAFLAAPVAAEVTVRVVPATGATPAHVELTARAAPLAEVLDRLGRQIGMKVVYEGASPRQLVTLSLQGRSPAETVLGLLEGQGLNFALVSDPTGARVETLLVAGVAPSSGSSMPAATAARSVPSSPFRRPLSPPPGSGPDTVDEETEELEADEGFDEPATAEGPEAGQAGANPVPVPQGPGEQPAVPGQSFPVSPFAPQSAPYVPRPFPPLPPGVPGGPPTTAPATPQAQPEAPAQPPPG